MQECRQYYTTYKHQVTEYQMTDGSNEPVNLLSISSWYAKINDKLKFRCFKELATVKFTPALNLKSSE